MKKVLPILLCCLFLKCSLVAQEQLTQITGISKIDTINKKIIFLASEKNGLNLYSTDGTKEGLKLLSTLSSKFIPKQPNLPNTYINMIDATRYGDEFVYRVMGNQFSYTSFSYLYAVANGIDKSFTIFETDKPLAGSIVHKTGGYYYHAFVESNGSILDSMTIVRYNNNGVQESSKKINIAFKDYYFTAIYNLRIVADKYLVFHNTETYINGNLQTVIDITTGTRFDSPGFYYTGTVSNRILFKKSNQGKWDLYTLVNNEPVKILEDYAKFSILSLSDKLMLYDANSIYIYNFITNETTKVSNVSLSLPIEGVKEIEAGILLEIASDANRTSFEYKLLKGNVLENMSIKTNQRIFSYPSADIRVDGKDYYYFSYYESPVNSGLTYTYGLIYTYNGAEFKQIASFNKGNVYLKSSNAKGYFYESDNTLFFWSPVSGSKIVIPGFYGFSKEWQSGQNILFKAYKNGPESGSVLIMTDGSPEGTKVLNLNLPVLTEVVLRHGNKLYIQNNTPDADTEFWETDGTQEGTKKIAHFNKEIRYFSNFTIVNDIPVCTATLREWGNQLFSLKPTLVAPVLAVPNSQACEGEEILLTAPKDYDNYKWTINNTEQVITSTNKLAVKKTGKYQVIVQKGEKSSLPSNIVSINFVTLPPKPTIVLVDYQLVANTSASTIQWYLDNTLISGADQKNLSYNGNGDYMVKVTENGCSNTSDAFKVSITSLEEGNISTKIYPNPSSKILIIEQSYQNQPIQLMLTDIKGTTILKEEIKQSKYELDISGISRGVYLLKINEQVKKIVVE